LITADFSAPGFLEDAPVAADSSASAAGSVKKTNNSEKSKPSADLTIYDPLIHADNY
jgi:hypothetical protein